MNPCLPNAGRSSQTNDKMQFALNTALALYLVGDAQLEKPMPQPMRMMASVDSGKVLDSARTRLIKTSHAHTHTLKVKEDVTKANAKAKARNSKGMAKEKGAVKEERKAAAKERKAHAEARANATAHQVREVAKAVAGEAEPMPPLKKRHVPKPNGKLGH
jgi:hypothetical protein